MHIHIRWENPDKKRFYIVYLDKDLFDQIVLTKVWGSMSASTGRITNHPCSSVEEGVNLIKKISLVRSQHGYHLKLQISDRQFDI